MKDFWVTIVLVTFLAGVNAIMVFGFIHIYNSTPKDITIFTVPVGK